LAEKKRHDWFLNQIFHHRGGVCTVNLGKLTSGGRRPSRDLVQETYVRIYALPDYLQVESPKGLVIPDRPHNLAVERAPAAEDPGHRHNGGFRVPERLFF